MDVSDILNVKIDPSIDPINQDLNCFDFQQDQYNRVYTILEYSNKSL